MSVIFPPSAAAPWGNGSPHECHSVGLRTRSPSSSELQQVLLLPIYVRRQLGGDKSGVFTLTSFDHTHYFCHLQIGVKQKALQIDSASIACLERWPISRHVIMYLKAPKFGSASPQRCTLQIEPLTLLTNCVISSSGILQS